MMNTTIMFDVVEALTEEGANALFEELRTLPGVTQDVGRLHNKKHTEIYRSCYLRTASEDKNAEVMVFLYKDSRVESAYVPAPRYLISPVDVDDS